MVYLSSTTYLIYATQLPQGYLKKDWNLWKYPLSQDIQIWRCSSVIPTLNQNLWWHDWIECVCGVYVVRPVDSGNHIVWYKLEPDLSWERLNYICDLRHTAITRLFKKGWVRSDSRCIATSSRLRRHPRTILIWAVTILTHERDTFPFTPFRVTV